ncbi:mycofactocin precursor MftA [Leucobacter allii]|nr:mycofactocin precursor MftA [Leucobacter allii]UOR02299.1 mycofactocin precursor MftA [Leucobacter allii]
MDIRDTQTSAPAAQPQPPADALVEEVSIDGMCGVY